MRKLGRVLAFYLTGAVILLVLWELIAQILQLPIVPTPQRVAEKLVRIFWDFIAIHGGYSLWRIAAGLVLAVGVGYPLGLVMGYFIMDAWLRVNYLEMYAGIVVLSIMGLLLFGLIDAIEATTCRWQNRQG